jgi:hypothetical protein
LSAFSPEEEDGGRAVPPSFRAPQWRCPLLLLLLDADEVEGEDEEELEEEEEGMVVTTKPCTVRGAVAAAATSARSVARLPRVIVVVVVIGVLSSLISEPVQFFFE